MNEPDGSKKPVSFPLMKKPFLRGEVSGLDRLRDAELFTVSDDLPRIVPL